MKELQRTYAEVFSRPISDPKLNIEQKAIKTAQELVRNVNGFLGRGKKRKAEILNMLQDMGVADNQREAKQIFYYLIGNKIPSSPASSRYAMYHTHWLYELKKKKGFFRFYNMRFADYRLGGMADQNDFKKLINLN